MRNLNKLLKGDHILGLTNFSFEKDHICSACQAGKRVGVSHQSKSIVIAVKPLELLHMDLFGPVAYISMGGNKYGLVIVDNCSRFTWIFFLHDKVSCKIHSRNLQKELKMNLKPRSRK
jgi:hypothetical protein